METACPMRPKIPETGDLGYGALVIKNGMIIGWAPCSVIVNRDPTGRVEIEAIRDASRRFGTQDLSRGVLVSTSRSCPVCEGGGYYASIERIYHAHTADDITNAGPPQMTYFR